MSLVFRPGNHTYWLDGQHIPGVTTLIKKGLPAPALVRWSAKTVAEWVAEHPDITELLHQHGGTQPLIGFLSKIPWQQRDDAAVRGTDVHALAERLIHGEPVDVPDHLTAYVDGYVNWLNEFNPKPLLTERPIGNRRWWYAGTFDLIAELLGETWLLDVKTSKRVYGNNAIQLAAYAGAEFYLDEDGAEQPLPGIDRLGILHVTPYGTTLHPVQADQQEAAWKDWLHIAWVGKAEKRIDAYFGSPIEQPPTEVGAA